MIPASENKVSKSLILSCPYHTFKLDYLKKIQMKIFTCERFGVLSFAWRVD